MLNHSLAQLRQVAFASLALQEPVQQQGRSASGSIVHFTTPTKPPPAWSRLDGAQENVPESPTKRPGQIRRRSTRTKAVLEETHAPTGRHELAIYRHMHESFFVLTEQGETQYISEVQSGQSPVFLPFRIESRARQVDLVLYTRTTRQETDSREAHWHPLIKMDIQLNRLKGIGPKAQTREVCAVLMQFSGPSADWYVPLSKSEQLPQRYVAPKASSHSFNQLMRLQMLTEVINDTRVSIHNMRDRIEALLASDEEHRETICKSEAAQVLMVDCHTVTTRLKRSIASDRHKVAMLRERNKRRAARLAAEPASRPTISQVEELRARTATSSAQLVLISSEMRRVQRVVTTVLSSVYPICTTPSQHTIRNLSLARHSIFSASYSAEEAAALGWTAHLIALLAQYLHVPLRYPLLCCGSSSYVIDPISTFPESSDQDDRGVGPPYSMRKDRRYPLFYSKADMPRFNYGVYLLNKNVEQLMQARGLVCGDIRDTLINLGVLVFWTTSITEDEDLALSSPARRRRLSNATVRRTQLSRIDSVDESALASAGEEADDEIVNHEDVLRARSKVKVQGLLHGDARQRPTREKIDLGMSSEDEGTAVL
ncbi:hypothetical protein BCR37DRAFT_395644 [Protomyces lactucae-debilis]|uniref:Autophagy-related protein 14 n=1 Tax=Protomyces lactucae-debilis TaxID=2754530 RepID=A0A1Y2EV52_PROLT|nr:uncharacterized protein BCR37DRAFT_395644 [Protomyces lactucae-debilis]ORY75144.1 hypothetical protein BCR37DRAFT_395644 [Protomyces lactucae-debilis]